MVSINHEVKLPISLEDLKKIRPIDIKWNMELFLDTLPQMYRKFYPNEYIIKQTSSGSHHAIRQAGIVVFETRDKTWWLIPTDLVNNKVTPHQYIHRIATYSLPKAALVSYFGGLEAECVEKILREQEEFYKFSMRDFMTGRNWLKLFTDFINQTIELKLFNNDFIKEFQDKIFKISKNIRHDLGMPSEDDLPETSIDDEIDKAEKRLAKNKPPTTH